MERFNLKIKWLARLGVVVMILMMVLHYMNVFKF